MKGELQTFEGKFVTFSILERSQSVANRDASLVGLNFLWILLILGVCKMTLYDLGVVLQVGRVPVWGLLAHKKAF